MYLKYNKKKQPNLEQYFSAANKICETCVYVYYAKEVLSVLSPLQFLKMWKMY